MGFIVVGLTSFMSQTAVIYGTNANNISKLNTSFNKMAELNLQVQQFKNNESVKTFIDRGFEKEQRIKNEIEKVTNKKERKITFAKVIKKNPKLFKLFKLFKLHKLNLN